MCRTCWALDGAAGRYGGVRFSAHIPAIPPLPSPAFAPSIGTAYYLALNGINTSVAQDFRIALIHNCVGMWIGNRFTILKFRVSFFLFKKKNKKLFNSLVPHLPAMGCMSEGKSHSRISKKKKKKKSYIAIYLFTQSCLFGVILKFAEDFLKGFLDSILRTWQRILPSCWFHLELSISELHKT